MIASLIAKYGYIAVLIGTFFEGETVLLLGSFSAQQGYLHLGGVILAAFTGTLVCDLTCFYLGRRHSQYILMRFPKWRNQVDRLSLQLTKFQGPMIMALRFLYGMRMIGLFAIGLSTVPTWKFLFYNTLSLLIWATAIGCGGYIFGHALELLISDIKHYQAIIFGLICGAGILIWSVRAKKLS